MAYFSNGSEGMVFDAECCDCILYDKNCPIFLAQIECNYEQCNNPVATKILNMLVKQDENYRYIGCQLKPILDQYYREKEDPNQGKLFK